MKRILLIAMLVICTASLASAAVGNIGVFADPVGSSCDVQDAAGLVDVYVVHVNATAAITSQFKMTQDASIAMTYIAGTVNSSLLFLGDVRTGITITYVGCKTNFPLELVHIQYFGTGTTTSCAKLLIEADPTTDSGEIEVVDCASVAHPLGMFGGSAMVNSTGDCGCDIATRETTWSKVKSLYK